MNNTTRVLFNTIVQYSRTFVTLIISLYTSRLILDALGVENYGIYSVVAGVVSMLSFIQASLSLSTQRFLSFHQGSGDLKMQKRIFNNSVITQLIISASLLILLLSLKTFLFENFLNIPENKIESGIWVYYSMLVILFFTMQSTPYMAALIAHENILYSSIVHLINTLLTIPIAISLTMISGDRLKLYATLLVLASVINYFLYYYYCKKRYVETKSIKYFSFDKSLFIEMFKYMGWNVYSAGCVVGRNQGIAILINKFFGTAVNAAYGLTLQVTGQLSFISASLQNAIRPQIIKAEGGNNREKMLRLSEMTSKFSFLLLAMITIPAIIEIENLLSLWLKEVPEYTAMLCKYTLLINLVDQLTVGLSTANHAIGNVKTFALYFYSIKFLVIPISLVLLLFGFPLQSIFVVYLTIEAIGVIIRLFILKTTGGLSIVGFLQKVIAYEIIPILITVIICLLISFYFNSSWSFILTFVASGIFMTLSTYFWGLCFDEKNIIDSIIKRFIVKIHVK